GGGGGGCVCASPRQYWEENRHGPLAHPRGNCRAAPPLVIRIGEAVQEADRHGLDLVRSERLNRAVDARVIEWEEHLALCINPLADRQAQSPGNERRRQIHVDIVLLEAVFVAGLAPVPESPRGGAGRAGAP